MSIIISMKKTRKKEKSMNEKTYWEDSVNLSKEVENCFSVPNIIFTHSISTRYSRPHTLTNETAEAATL